MNDDNNFMVLRSEGDIQISMNDLCVYRHFL